MKRVASTIHNFLKSKIVLMLICYSLAKLFLCVIQLPHMTKDQTKLPYLLFCLIFSILAIVFKLLAHQRKIIMSLVRIQKEAFIIWILTMIMMMFSWGLLDNLQWNMFENILLLICQFLLVFTVTLVIEPQFITKIQFISFEITLGSEIVAVSIKTVVFIKDHSESHDKDIVLLNLTTQIALMIVLMDAIHQSYRKMKEMQIADDMSRLENQMVLPAMNEKHSNTK